MFRVDVDGAAAGYAGWWEEEHDGVPVYEIGCVVEPGWQGRGVARPPSARWCAWRRRPVTGT